jgi:hypothetical protein
VNKLNGYSGKPLREKLGLRDNHRACVLDCPVDYRCLVPGLPEQRPIATAITTQADFVHAFVVESAVLVTA